MALKIDRNRSDLVEVITVEGEVDLYTSPDLRSAILKAVRKAKERIEVDLAGVAYMDSSGVATLVEGFKKANESSKAFVLVAPSNSVMKVLQLAKLDGVFHIKPAP
jgi:anti-sigma B factor antagonist